MKTAKSGAVYFGDDDNTYDLRLFQEIRNIKQAGVWPVGIVGGLIAETPILAENGTVSGFNAVWKPERPFPIDMAAFAINVTLIVNNPNAGFKYDMPRGYQVCLPTYDFLNIYRNPNFCKVLVSVGKI